MLRSGTSSHALLVLTAVALAACPKQGPATEKAELAAEIAEADAALAATTSEQALLKIARYQDARRDVLEVYPLRTHTDPVVRAAATRALGLIGDPDAASAIAGSLRDTDPRVRSAAAFALSLMPTWRTTTVEGALGPAQAEQWLLEALEEELEEPPRMAPEPPPATGPTAPPSVLRALARALGEIGQEDAAGALWGLVGSSAPERVRAEALLSLGIQARRGVAEPALTVDEIGRLAPLLIEKRPALQWPAAHLVSRAGVVDDARAQADATLAIAWKAAEDADVRAWILRSIGKVGGPSAAAVLGAGAAPDRPLRECVSAGRGASAAKDVELLLTLLDDPDALVRDEAAGALGRTGDDRAFDALMERIEAGPAAISALAGFLGTEEEPAPEERLIMILGVGAGMVGMQGRPKLRRAAYGLLAAVPGEAALGALMGRVDVADGATTMSEEDPTAALYLALAVSQRKEPAVEGALLGWLDGPDPMLGAVAADGLKEREGAHITTRLAEAFLKFPGPEDAERRLSIVKALVEREDTPAGTLFKAILDDDGLVREAATAGVRKQVGLARSDSKTDPRLRELPDLADHTWGVGDVTGAVVATPHGDITLQLFPDVAPGTVANFVGLAEQGYFDGLLFHRVVPDFVIQGGDPMGSGWGGPGHTIRCEYSPVDYERGTLGMALSGKDTGGSQWFITHTAQPHLTGHYTVFGRMTGGWDALDAVRVGDTIEKVTIVW